MSQRNWLPVHKENTNLNTIAPYEYLAVRPLEPAMPVDSETGYLERNRSIIGEPMLENQPILTQASEMSISP